MSRYCIPNSGPVVLILDTSEAKRDLLLALESAAEVGAIQGDLARFSALLDSHIELEAALAEQRLREAA